MGETLKEASQRMYEGERNPSKYYERDPSVGPSVFLEGMRDVIGLVRDMRYARKYDKEERERSKRIAEAEAQLAATEKSEK